jgi:hypothetical protein
MHGQQLFPQKPQLLMSVFVSVHTCPPSTPGHSMKDPAPQEQLELKQP